MEQNHPCMNLSLQCIYSPTQPQKIFYCNEWSGWCLTYQRGFNPISIFLFEITTVWIHFIGRNHERKLFGCVQSLPDGQTDKTVYNFVLTFYSYLSWTHRHQRPCFRSKVDPRRPAWKHQSVLRLSPNVYSPWIQVECVSEERDVVSTCSC